MSEVKVVDFSEMDVGELKSLLYRARRFGSLIFRPAYFDDWYPILLAGLTNAIRRGSFCTWYIVDEDSWTDCGERGEHLVVLCKHAFLYCPFCGRRWRRDYDW